MKEPIKAGDHCLVVSGLGRSKSPNAGKQVVVDKLMGEHSQHGRIWRCSGDGIVQLSDGGDYITTGWADFPTTWLQKIEPPQLENTHTSDNEIAA